MDRREFWRQAVDEVESGRSVGAVAARLGVLPRTLSWWRWKLRKEAAERAEQLRFLPVVVRGGPEREERGVAVAGALLEISVAADLTVRAPVGADVEYVASVVMALRRQC